MHPAIRVVSEGGRGCGHRKPGGLYLRLDGGGRGCGKLPVPLSVCPCCGEGIRPSRAPRLLQAPWRLWQDLACGHKDCFTCPLADGVQIGAALLVWVGEKHYPDPASFNREAAVMGISRRINAVPKGFEVGKTWVLLAHRKAIQMQPVDTDGLPGVFGQVRFTGEPVYEPGIFRLFKPDRIEIVVTGDEPDHVIEDYLARGLTPVLIRRAEKTPVVYEQRVLPGQAVDGR
ncbi:MAG: hypothetical protein JXB47_12750 [Anaerolineae bacterium]|nr:hypothetical protein [Anaerolineae bacterium]